MTSRCPHVGTIGEFSPQDILNLRAQPKCNSCDAAGPCLWACLHRNCLYVGCGEDHVDHSTKHFQEKKEHSLALNLRNFRLWCYVCQSEVFLENNDPPVFQPSSPAMTIPTSKVYVAEPDTDEENDDEMQNLKPRGLSGLQNLGNTCYMNAAIQALSNCPQLTQFFMDCGSFVRTDKKPGLSKSFMKLVCEMWNEQRPSYVVPSGIAHGIKMVFPVFRGYAQQDAQEFLRCFMDQLHEELKDQVLDSDGQGSMSSDTDDYDSCHGESTLTISEDTSSQSEAEFETCDSGLSSEKSSFAGEEFTDQAELMVVGESDSQFPACGGEAQRSQHCGTTTQEVKEALKREDSHRLTGSGDCAATNEPKDVAAAGDSEVKQLYSSSSFVKDSRRASGRHVCMPLSRGSSLPSRLQNVPKKKRRIHYRSIISDIFDGKILSSVQCLTCDTVSVTKETFQDISLPIPSRDHLHLLHASQSSHAKIAGTCTDAYSNQGWITWMFSWLLSWFWGPTVSLQDCLSAFFSADELKGDNMYSCDKCKKLRNGIKYSKVLSIHLKRFRHEVMFSSKINSYVSFPLEGLDMSPFLHKDCSRGVTTYDLTAVICHHGTAGSGHYTAYALNHLNDQWYEFDDQYVTAVDPQIVQNCEAYVLFYRKSSDEIIKKRQRAIELMDRSRTEPGLLQFYISKQWVNRFNTFAEPGPITNTDFLCLHGGVHPSKAGCVQDLCTVLSQAVWEYLHDTFGGGPPCNHLFICPTCQAEQDMLERRRKQEHDLFVTLNKDFKSQESPQIVYALSLNWFKQWENFVREKANEPPGPVDNSLICHVKNGQPVLKAGSDYGSISDEMWRFLHTIYGGGPEIILQQNPNPNSSASRAERLRNRDRESSTVKSHATFVPATAGKRPVSEEEKIDESGTPAATQKQCDRLKSSDEIIKKRQRAIELMDRSRTEPGLLQFYISKQWVNRFNTFAEPGPITNTDFLCLHGGVHPSKAGCVQDLCTVLSQAVWEYLHDTFGGGPPCNHLFICPTCQAEQDMLERRRKQEHDLFVTLNKDFKSQESPQIVYALSLNWFKQWENFVREKANEPPGPVDNSLICHVKNGQPVLKAGSDYGSISDEMWRFLHTIYGGGPEIILQQNPNPNSSASRAERLRNRDRESSTVKSHATFVPATAGKRPVSEEEKIDESGTPAATQKQCDRL